MAQKMRWLVVSSLAALTLVFGFAFVACGGDGSSPSVQDTQDDAALHVEGDEDEDEALHVEGDEDDDEALGEAQEVTVVASDTFSYEPAEITVTAGRPVRIALDNSGGVILHDFSVEGLPADDIHAEGAAHGHDAAATSDEHAHDEAGSTLPLHVAADAGGAGTLEFTPTQAGQYVFYCTVLGHREAGMEGTITVVEG